MVVPVLSTPSGPTSSGGAVPKEPSLDGTAVEAHRFNSLGISRHQIDGLVAPLDLVSVDIEYDALDRLLGLEFDGLTVILDGDLKVDDVERGEVNELEWLRPVGVMSTD